MAIARYNFDLATHLSSLQTSARRHHRGACVQTAERERESEFGADFPLLGPPRTKTFMALRDPVEDLIMYVSPGRLS
jgi:hypothetical protein